MEKWETVLEDDLYGVAAAVKSVTDIWKTISVEVDGEMFRSVSAREQGENDTRCRDVWGRMNGLLKSFPQAVYGQKMWREKVEKVLDDAMDKDVMFQL